jgi:hypothetical protein
MTHEDIALEAGHLIIEFIGAAVDQDPQSKKKYFEAENKFKTIIVRECDTAENRIRKVYELRVVTR